MFLVSLRLVLTFVVVFSRKKNEERKLVRKKKKKKNEKEKKNQLFVLVLKGSEALDKVQNILNQYHKVKSEAKK